MDFWRRVLYSWLDRNKLPIKSAQDGVCGCMFCHWGHDISIDTLTEWFDCAGLKEPVFLTKKDMSN